MNISNYYFLMFSRVNKNYVNLCHKASLFITKPIKMGRKGVEPSTFRLSVERSTKLSYRPSIEIIILLVLYFRDNLNIYLVIF